MLGTPTVDDWLVALPDMRRRGSEYCGPCPLCGEGDDRLHLRADGIISCRVCMDNQLSSRVRYGELVHRVFGHRFGLQSCQRSRNSALGTMHSNPSPSVRPKREPKTDADLRNLAAAYGLRPVRSPRL